MLETLQGDLGCNTKVEGLKLNLAIFHHISSACNSASVEAILYL